MQAIANRFLYEGMIRNLNRANDVVAAGRLVGEHSGQKVVGSHPLNRRRNLASSREAQDGEGPRCIPSPARREHRRIEQRLSEDVLHCCDIQEFENQLERETMLLAQRDDDAVVCRSRLKLEVECPAKSLAQGQAPCAIDLRSKRSVQHKLHAAAFIKETFGDDRRLGGQCTQRGRASAHVQRGLLRAAPVQCAFAHEPFDGFRLLQNFRTDIRHFLR